MTSIHTILSELNLQNGKNHKLAVLKKYSDNALFARVLKLTLDRVIYRYYVTLNYWHKKHGPNAAEDMGEGMEGSLLSAFDFLENKLATRELTGNAAIEALDKIFTALNVEDRILLMKIVNRDLRINCGRTLINKIFEGLITKPLYMRCGIFNEKTLKDIKFPAIIQLKADGTYREMHVSVAGAEFISRSGESYSYDFHEKFAKLPAGYYVGEMLVEGTANRGESNGLLNSDNPPMDKIVYQCWDYITEEEYADAAKKKKTTTPYHIRFDQLTKILTEFDDYQIQPIESYEVTNSNEAFEKVVAWMNSDLEGGVLKDKNGLFKDGTSRSQLKMKLELNLDVRVTGFKEGRIGTSREDTFGAIEFETDDGKIKGRTSGFTNEQLEQINSNRDSYVGMIMSVTCNDITKGRDSEHYALSHPRVDEFRTDKNETDTLERAMEIKQMAMCF